MPKRPWLDRYLKDSRWIVAGLALLLIALTSIYYFIQRSRELPSALVTNRVLLFVLWNIDLLLILAILFGFFRNLFKLVVERQTGILGSKLKTKLIATYVLLSLIPVLLLFGYGTQLLSGWIERWFDEAAIKRVAEQGYAVAEGLRGQLSEWNLKNAERAHEAIGGMDLTDARRRPQLDSRLQQLRSELDVDYLAVYADTRFVHAVVLPQAGLRQLPQIGERFLLAALRRGQDERFLDLPGSQGHMVLTAVAEPLPEDPSQPTGDDQTAPARAVVVAGTLVDPELATQSAELIEAFQGYRQLEARKPEIETAYRLIFLMVTLVILLATLWVGWYLARRITVPIEAVAEGTRRLSEGDLDYRVEVPADDELGVLVNSFNLMTEELQRNKQDLLGANQRLQDERALIAAVLENVAAGVISVDDAGRILVFNRAALKMLHLDREAISGLTIQEAWADGELAKLRELFEREPGAAGRFTRTLRLVLGGQLKTFEAKLRTMRDNQGQVSGRVMVLEDLTELIQAQQRAAWHDARAPGRSRDQEPADSDQALGRAHPPEVPARRPRSGQGARRGGRDHRQRGSHHGGPGGRVLPVCPYAASSPGGNRHETAGRRDLAALRGHQAGRGRRGRSRSGGRCRGGRQRTDQTRPDQPVGQRHRCHRRARLGEGVGGQDQRQPQDRRVRHRTGHPPGRPGEALSAALFRPRAGARAWACRSSTASSTSTTAR